MLELPLFFKAMGMGLAVAAPVGPMSLLCMRTALTRGWRHGLAIGGGIAIGDGLYGAVAALGLASVAQFVFTYDKPLHIAAGLFLVYLGLKSMMMESVPIEEQAVSHRGLRSELAMSVLLTLTNPPTIVMFAALFAALAPAGGFAPADAFSIVAGIFMGSLLWWCLIVGAVTGLRHVLGHAARSWIDRIAGVALAILGLFELRRGLS